MKHNHFKILVPIIAFVIPFLGTEIILQLF